MIYTVKNKTLQRRLEVNGGKLKTSRFLSVSSGDELITGKDSAEFVFVFTDGSRILSDDLTVSEIKGSEENLEVIFKEYKGLKASVRYFSDESGFILKKQLEFSDKKERKINYIILECVDFSGAETTESTPDDIGGALIDGYHISLGQPFFADSFFFGCEFPATENRIKNTVGEIVYYSGKSASDISRIPVTVVGSGKSKNFFDVRTAFFDYIDAIALPCRFRLQYNSWYDGMLEIEEKKIGKTFSEVSAAFEKYGVPKPDAYTVDDGWNDYKAPFWSFNEKFPERLENVSSLTKEIGSSLGLWLGPRGGYNNQTVAFAKRIQKRKHGSFNPVSRDICVADKTYQKNVKAFLSENILRLDLSYLKLDGFCLKPCNRKRHNHIVGGNNGMYTVTEMWEGWIEVFKQLRSLRTSQGKELFINMTCYVNPSPWWLQYVNSLWLQNSGDIGFSSAYKTSGQADSEITYRDSRYYDFVVKRRFFTPLRYIYNHEPIYGKSAGVSYSDGEFEKYLMFNACRGQSLNELHLSCSMMSDKKWEILSKVLNWQKENYEILKNAVFAGSDPEKDNAYAYCSFTPDGRGIIAVRNPSDRETKFSLSLNVMTGCRCENAEFRAKCVFGSEEKVKGSYSYGEEIEFDLSPYEILILSFDRKKNSE